MMLSFLIAGLLDCMTVIPLTIVVLLVMLQDRRRPLWPVALMVAPLIAGLAWCIATRSYTLLPVLYVYFLLMWLGFIINMVLAMRQYGRWLRDNYADLEHKEVWQGFVLLAIFFLVYAIYSLDVGELIYEYASEVINIVLICYLLWRVETLSDLSLSQINHDRSTLDALPAKNVEALLQQYCVDTQLYLQHDLNVIQLAKAIGTNRTYLSQYFSSLGTTYNAYINVLRINHFVRLYHEAIASHRSFTAQQLAQESGYRNYKTFSLAFKQRMGRSVTAWMSDPTE
jgi:AraC-like DNA-binding protein